MPHATGDDEHSAPNDQYRADLGMLSQTTEQQLQAMRNEHPEIRERERRAELTHMLTETESRTLEGAFRHVIDGEDPSDLHHNVDAILALGEIVRRLGALPAGLRTATPHTTDDVLHPHYYEYVPRTGHFFLVTRRGHLQELPFADDDTLYDVRDIPEQGHPIGRLDQVTGREMLHEQRRLANFVGHQHSISHRSTSKIGRSHSAFVAQSRKI